MAMSVEEIVAAMQALIDSATTAGEPMTEDDLARYSDLEGQLTAIRKTEEVQKRHAAWTGAQRPAGGLIVATQKVDDEHSRAFNDYIRTGQASRELIQFRAQSEGVGSAGGFLVPESFMGKIVEKRVAFGGLAAAASTINTASGNPIYWVTNDETSAALAEVTPEAGLWDTGADLAFGTRTLGAYKYTTVGASQLPLKVSYELLQDAEFDLQGFIAKKFAIRIARKQAVDFITGTGVNEPMGLLSTAGGLGSSGVTIASNAVGPTYANLLTIIHSLDPEYRDGAKWIMNDATLGLIQGLVDSTGRPLLWNQNGDLEAAAGGLMLLGYPVVIDQAMPSAAASAKFMVFGDLSEAYVVRRVKGFSMVVLNELYAQNGQVGFMGWERADGMVQDPNAAKYVTAAA